VDNPVGVGFSYTASGAGYRTAEEQIGNDMDLFYVNFFARYPFLTGGLYLTGYCL
jgi:carboxypeptidase C (cathepsin A)